MTTVPLFIWCSFNFQDLGNCFGLTIVCMHVVGSWPIRVDDELRILNKMVPFR